MKRIAFINDHLGQGGVGTVNQNLILELRDQGHRVSNVTIFKEHAIEGVVNFHLGLSSIQAVLVLPFLYKLIRLFRNNKFDLVISSKDYINIWVIAAFHLAKPLHGKLLVNSHISPTAKFRHESKLIQLFSLRCARFMYRYADIVANVSEAASRDSEQYFGLSKVHTLYNPVITPTAISQTFKRPEHPFFYRPGKVIVSCGRLEDQKNHILMIQAFAEALKYRRDLY